MKIISFIAIILAVGFLFGMGYSWDNVPRVKVELSANPFILLFIFFGLLLCLNDNKRHLNNE